MTDRAVEVIGADQVNAARRAASEVARSVGFSEEDEGRVSLVATEVATNLVKHGRGGHVLISILAASGHQGVRVLAIDRGPGIADVPRSMRDGFSSAGSPGTGLGAIERQSDRFDLWSRPNRGTAVLAHLWPRANASKPPAEDLSLGGVSIPMSGEDACGDAWSTFENNGHRTLLVTDGLGHGPLAQAASARADELFQRIADRPPAEILEAMHAGLRSTRGAAVAVLRIDQGETDITYCGVGNIAACIIGADRTRNLVSHHGTVGHHVSRVQEFRYPFPPEATLVLNTDGLTSQWGLDEYAGLLQRHPSVVASVLYRDFSRGRDDATVVVVRRRP